MPSVVLARRLSCDPTRCAAALLPAPGLFALFCADWLAPPPRLRTCPSCSDAASCRPRACTRVRSRAAPRARSSSRCVILPVRTLVPCPSQTLPVHPVTGASSSPPSSEVGEPLLMRVGEVAFVAPPHRWHGCHGGHKRQPCYVARLLGQHPTDFSIPVLYIAADGSTTETGSTLRTSSHQGWARRRASRVDCQGRSRAHARLGSSSRGAAECGDGGDARRALARGAR